MVEYPGSLMPGPDRSADPWLQRGRIFLGFGGGLAWSEDESMMELVDFDQGMIILS